MPLSGGLYNILHKMPVVWFERSYIHQLLYLLDFVWNYDCIFGTQKKFVDKMFGKHCQHIGFFIY